MPVIVLRAALAWYARQWRRGYTSPPLQAVRWLRLLHTGDYDLAIIHRRKAAK